MADGGVDFAVRLINDVTRPAKAIQSAMRDVKRTFQDVQNTVAAPAPKRGGMSDWQRMTAKAHRSQAADFAREQQKLTRVKASEQAKATKASLLTQKKEAQRIADFKHNLAQTKLDHQTANIGAVGNFAMAGVAAIATAAIAAAAAVGYLAYQFGRASVEAAAFAEQSRMAIGFLLGSAPRAAEQFNRVRFEAQALGLDVEDTVHGFQKLLAAQFSVGKAKELLRMSSDLQAIGASAEQTKRAIVAISQIKNTGYLQGDELNQLREAGVSTELVYEALGKRLNKSTAQLIQMQEKRQLAAEPVIESILEAVRKKTGVEKAGDAGKKFAESTLIGMMGVLRARSQNFFIDVGDAILPGVQKLFKLVTGTLGAVAEDPKIKALGTFLLREFEIFVLWAEANWPAISELFVKSAKLMGDAIRFTVELFDTSTIKGMAFAGVLGTLALALGLVALATFVFMLPLYLLIGAVGLVAYAIYKAVEWIISSVGKLSSQFTLGSVAAGGKAKQALGIQPSTGAGTAAAPAITTAAETGPTARVPGALASVTTEHLTVASEEQGGGGTANNFDFSGMQVGANVDQADLTAKIRSQVTKAIEEMA